MVRHISLVLCVAAFVAVTTAAPPAGAALYPVDGDGAYTANVLRRFNHLGQFSTTATVFGNGPSPAGAAIDGAHEKLQWTTGSGTNPNPAMSGTLRLTLDQIYSFRKFNHEYQATVYRPASYTIKVSTTGFGSMTTVASGGVPNLNHVDLVNPALAVGRFVEYSWQGTDATQYVLLQEFEAYAAAGDPNVHTKGGFDLLSLPGETITDLTPGKWIGGMTAATDLDHTTLLKGNAGLGQDATFLLELATGQKLSGISFGFFQDQTWGQGMRVEISADGLSYSDVRNTASESSDYIPISLASQPFVKYIRVTNKNGDNGSISDIQVFGIPEPTGVVMLGLGALATLGRRRRSA